MANDLYLMFHKYIVCFKITSSVFPHRTKLTIKLNYWHNFTFFESILLVTDIAEYKTLYISVEVIKFPKKKKINMK